MVVEKAKVRETDITTKHDKELYGLRRQLEQDEQAAYRTYQDELAKIASEGVQDRKKVLETEFKEGFVGADDYLSRRKMLVQEELDVTLDGLKLKRDAAKDNLQEQAKLDTEEVEARRKADNEIIDLDQHKADIALEALKNHYEQARKYLALEATIAKGTRFGTATQDQVAINSTILQMTREYVNQLEQQRAPLQAGSEAWTHITEQIAQATEEQQKLNLELIQAKDIATPLSGLFGSLSGLLGQFKGAGSQAASGIFANLSGAMEKLGQFTTFIQMQRTGGKAPNLEEVRATAARIFSQRMETATTTVDIHSRALMDDIAALRAHAQALGGKKGVSRVGGPSYGPIGPSFQHGGEVPGSGPVPVVAHGGETIHPAGAIEKFVVALKKAVDALQQLVFKVKSVVSPGALPAPGMYPATTPAPLNTASAGVAQNAPGAPGGGDQSASSQLLAPMKNLSNSFTKLFDSSSEAANGASDFGSKMNDLVGAIEGWVKGIQGVVQGITAGKTGASGALSGGMAGLKFGAAFGPWGALAGGVGGAIAGGIFGAQEKQLHQDIHKIQDQMQAIVDSMTEGAITLSTAIQDMRQEREAAIKMLSHDPKASKGGGGKKGFTPSQGQAVIDQIDTQIAQLVNSQQQLLSQLDQQVAILSNPLPFQQYVQSLDQIIEKYQQFSSAAGGNAQAVANAQLYLNESLQAYVTTLGQQLNQAQQQAIQDSLTLLNLEYQRQQIINQEAQQEYDILTQGVLTRQRTTAMTKGQQIGQIQYQANMQLQQIDEQIALQQYKVQTEQKIFDLATTRIGLEAQLLSLQEQQADTQNQQTAALLQVVQELQAGMASGSLMNQLTALGSTPTGTGLLTTLMGSLGLGGNVPPGILTGVGGATNYLSQIPQQYQSITNYLNNLDPNFLMNLWNAMQTPAGSYQRQSVVAEAKPYADDANTSGYDMNSFIQWIQSGAQIAASTVTATNTPAPTGPQGLPPGTPFAQPTTPGIAPSSIPGYTGGGGQTPYQAVSNSMNDLNTNTQSVSTSMGQLATNLQAVLTGIKQGYTGAKVGAGGGPIVGGNGGPFGGPSLGGIPIGGPIVGSPTPLAPVPVTTNPMSYPQPTGAFGTMWSNAVKENPNLVGDVQAYMTASGQSKAVVAQSLTQDFMAAVIKAGGFPYLGLGDLSTWLQSLPQYQTGGPVTKTGPIFADEGEWVLPKPVVGILKTIKGFGKDFGRLGPSPIMPSPISGGTERWSVENDLYGATMKRTNLEMNVISARQDQINYEMQYLSALNDTMSKMATLPTGPAGALESMFNQSYQTRGRYGSAGFRREYL